MAYSSMTLSRRYLVAAAAGAVSLVLALPAAAQETIKLGLVAALSGQSAKSGEAIPSVWNNSGLNAYPAGSHRKGVAISFAFEELEKPGCSTKACA